MGGCVPRIEVIVKMQKIIGVGAGRGEGIGDVKDKSGDTFGGGVRFRG